MRSFKRSLIKKFAKFQKANIAFQENLYKHIIHILGDYLCLNYFLITICNDFNNLRNSI